jgi:hypothetical protein
MRFPVEMLDSFWKFNLVLTSVKEGHVVPSLQQAFHNPWSRWTGATNH